MSLRIIARELIALCNRGKNLGVTRTIDAPDVVVVEGGRNETAGPSPVLQIPDVCQANDAIHVEKVTRPIRSAPGLFAVFFAFEFTRISTSKRVSLNVYTARDGDMPRERFSMTASGDRE